MRRAQYRVIADSCDSLTIEDIGPWDRYPTVTNDAEQVVADVLPVLSGRRLLYYDSEGELCELLIKDGKFAGFGG